MGLPITSSGFEAAAGVRGLNNVRCVGERQSRNFVVDLYKNCPRIVAADNTSYNTSELTQECSRRIDVTPRFSTPHHPEGNSSIERYQAAVNKSMINHAVNSRKKD